MGGAKEWLHCTATGGVRPVEWDGGDAGTGEHPRDALQDGQLAEGGNLLDEADAGEEQENGKEEGEG